MRIEELALERYGSFTDRMLAFRPQAALHVVLGANEAGKTSALSAIGDLLFGFGARTDYDFMHDSKLLRVGGTFRHSDGRAIMARRRKGNKNTLLDADDQPLSDDHFTALLGGVSRAAFGLEFGMTAQSLRDGGGELLSAGGRLAETLAAGSAGMTGLSQLKDRLQTEADALFTARKSGSKPFYLAGERWDTADKALRDAVVTRDALKQLESAVGEAAAQLDQLKVAHAASGVTLARWQRTLRVRSQLARLDAIAVDLVDLADLPAVQDQMLADWRCALENKAARDAEIAALDAAATAEAAEIDAVVVDDALLAEGSAIESLRERLGAARKAHEDLPRRRRDRDNAEAALNDSARRLGLASHVELLTKLPTDPALADARALIEQTRRATKELADIDARYARLRQEHDASAMREDEALFAGDIEPVRQRFAALGDIPAQDERLHGDRAALTIEVERLRDAVAAIDPAPGSLERLRALPVPDRTTIAKYASDVESRETEVKRLDLAIASLDEAIAGAQADLARLSSSGPVPSRADLFQARQIRDARLDALRDGLDGEAGARIARFETVAAASRDIDGITDLLLTDTERATLQDNAQRQLADAESARERETAKRTGLQRELTGLDSSWKQLWIASGLVPRIAPDMLRWRERFDDIVVRLEKSDLQRTAIEARSAALEAGKAATVRFLESVGGSPDAALPAGNLYREAKAKFDALQAASSDAKVRAANRLRLDRDLAEAETTRGQIQTRLARLQQQWPQTMRAIGLADDVSPDYAEAALLVWHSVTEPRVTFQRESRSVATIKSDLETFAADVAAILDRVAPELRALPPSEALMQAADRLVEARRNSDARKRLQGTAAKRAVSRAALVAQLAASVAALDDACRTLGVTEVASLPEPIDRLVTRSELQREQAKLRHGLLEIADGHDEDALRREREGVDLDRLQADIASETVQQQQWLKDITEASAAHHQRLRELETLQKGRNAASAATQRQEAGADMVSIAEDWLLRSAAALLARRAIDLHRAKVQNPIIARAGDLFALATAGAFAGLAIDYGDEDQPTLVTRRASGEQVRVEGLSEGTRDQLYLALRLALLERRTSEPLPFIGDDLLASFDERRTLATLRLLAAAGQARQMIVFTHHRHVADLATSLTEHHVDLIEL